MSDQLKSGVTVSCRYEPGMNTAYLDFARHYGTALVPARPRKPFSLAELNAHIRRRLDEMNDRPMRAYGKSRRQLVEELDRPALRPLPAVTYEYAQWKRACVNIDCHVELRYTESTVEILYEGLRTDCCMARNG